MEGGGADRVEGKGMGGSVKEEMGGGDKARSHFYSFRFKSTALVSEFPFRLGFDSMQRNAELGS